jgi:hypothetical protein
VRFDFFAPVPTPIKLNDPIDETILSVGARKGQTRSSLVWRGISLTLCWPKRARLRCWRAKPPLSTGSSPHGAWATLPAAHLVAAQRLGRRWVGIDVTHLAIALIKHRLKAAFENDAKFQTIGEPASLPDAEALALLDKYQFQWWALSLVNASPTEKKKGADKGVDGRLYFHVEKGEDTQQVIFSVKGGNFKPSDVRDLRGVVEREKAVIGVLVSLHDPTGPMKEEAASAGFWKPKFGTKKYPRIQLLTVEQLLEGKTINIPPHHVNLTFKKAPKAKSRQKEETPDTIFHPNEEEADDE